MEIVYISNYCDEKLFSELFQRRLPTQAANKFHGMLLSGLAMQPNITIHAVSVIPVSRASSNRFFLHPRETSRGKLEIVYLPIIQLKVVKNIILFTSAFFACLLSPRCEHIVFDIFTISASLGAMLAAKLRGIPTCAIVTDLPQFQYEAHNSIALGLVEKLLGESDAYVFLTKQMNELKNLGRKPYLIMEGFTDKGIASTVFPGSERLEKKICMYAGGIKREYGIVTLVCAFTRVAREGEELHIYGSGEAQEEVRILAERTRNVKYFGTVLNSIIIGKEMNATLLVNPRPVCYEYTKYSFPSKTIEYMSSGTPLISTKLPGIPDEYFRYIYAFDADDEETMAKNLRHVLDKPREELAQKGWEAKEFVVREKNNTSQAKRLAKLLLSIG